jgi:hypothetical protein
MPVGDGYTPISGANPGNPSGQRGSPLNYTQTPRDYVSSLISAGSTVGNSSWVALNQQQGPSYLELTEILLYETAGVACIFGLAIVPINNIPDFIASAHLTRSLVAIEPAGLAQPYVIFVQNVPAGNETDGNGNFYYTNGSTQALLSTAVYQNEQLLIWCNGTVNYRISGKVIQ